MHKLPIEAKDILFPFFDQLTDDAELMNNIAGCYLVGSVASGDFRRGGSNVDLVIVTRNTWDSDAETKLKQIHRVAAKQSNTLLRGYYITTEQLQQPATEEGISVCTVNNGIYKSNAPLALDRIALYELKNNAMLLHGKPVEELLINVDIKDVIAQLHADVNMHWGKWLRAHRWPMPKGWSLLMNPKVSEYGVLGIARPLYTLRSGTIGSKHLAGVFLSRYFKDEHADIIKLATQLRQQKKVNKGFSPDRYKRTRAVMKSALEAFNKDYDRVIEQL